MGKRAWMDAFIAEYDDYDMPPACPFGQEDLAMIGENKKNGDNLATNNDAPSLENSPTIATEKKKPTGAIKSKPSHNLLDGTTNVQQQGRKVRTATGPPAWAIQTLEYIRETEKDWTAPRFPTTTNMPMARNNPIALDTAIATRGTERVDMPAQTYARRKNYHTANRPVPKMGSPTGIPTYVNEATSSGPVSEMGSPTGIPTYVSQATLYGPVSQMAPRTATLTYEQTTSYGSVPQMAPPTATPTYEQTTSYGPVPQMGPPIATPTYEQTTSYGPVSQMGLSIGVPTYVNQGTSLGSVAQSGQPNNKAKQPLLAPLDYGVTCEICNTRSIWQPGATRCFDCLGNSPSERIRQEVIARAMLGIWSCTNCYHEADNGAGKHCQSCNQRQVAKNARARQRKAAGETWVPQYVQNGGIRKPKVDKPKVSSKASQNAKIAAIKKGLSSK